MTAEPDNTASRIDTLIADYRATRTRLRQVDAETVTTQDLLRELVDNTYPSLIALGEEVRDMDDAYQEFMEQEGSYLQPDVVARIMAPFHIAAGLVTEVRKELSSVADDLARRRIEELLVAYERAAQLAIMTVDECIVLDDEDDESDPGEVTAPDSETVDDDATQDQAEPTTNDTSSQPPPAAS